MRRLRLVAYYVFIYAVPGAYKIEHGFLVPRRVHNRIVRVQGLDF